MTEQQEKKMSTFNVTCGDDSEGRLSAESPDEAARAAAEMCQVHDGIKAGPSPRPER